MATISTPHSRMELAGWVSIATLVHGTLAIGLIAYLCLYVPAQSSLYQDLGLELPLAVVLLIDLATLVQAKWFILLPLLLFIILAVDFAIVSLIRSRIARAICLSALALLPVVTLVIWHLLLTHTTATLIDNLS